MIQIAHYHIQQELGRGGFATVYLAEDRQNGQTVALKVLLPHTVLESEQVKRFEREAKALTRLDRHPNIITIYDFGQADGEIYLVMEYLPGGSLRDYLRSQPDGLSTRQVLVILEQLATALDHAHSQGLIHRDIKPDNVLLDHADSPRRVVLTDFGLVKYPFADESLTISSTVLGTRGYIAPEQFIGTAREVTPASDIYSLSALAYQLFTGELPPMLSEPVDPAQLNPALAETIVHALRRGLAKNPVERPASARDFITLLQTKHKPSVLVVDDDKNMRLTISHILREDYVVDIVDGIGAALTRLAHKPFEAIIVDLNMAGDERAGFKLLERIGQKYPHLRKVILTARYDLTSVAEGYDYGVDAYVPKDQRMADNLRQKLARALER